MNPKKKNKKKTQSLTLFIDLFQITWVPISQSKYKNKDPVDQILMLITS